MASGMGRIYLRIFADVVRAVMAVAELGVVHYDLKCDNILLETRSVTTITTATVTTAVTGHGNEDDARSPVTHARGPGGGVKDTSRLPFRVILADYGESVRYAPGVPRLTDRNRGTEYIKSPEMLQLEVYENKLSSVRSSPRKVGGDRE